MDNSVYQPLSHALQPPSSSSSYVHESQHQVAKSNGNDHTIHVTSASHQPQEEEEEEEEIDATLNTSSASAQTAAAALANNEPPRRKPGRPKGSKNKKKYDLSDSTPKQQFATTPFYGYTPPQAPPAATPVIPPVQTPAPQSQPIPQPAATVPFPALDANNQAFYDFQWRVLTLCSEFYNAADELIRGAPQHIIAQCFNLPPNQIDPISILHEARRACDQLMANPSQAVLKISAQPSAYVPPTTTAKDSATPTTPGTTATTATASTSAPVITNPGSFVMSLSSSTPAQTAYTSFQPAANRYGTTPYSYYSTQPQQTGAHPYMAQQQVMKPVNLTTPAASGNQGAWSDEETERLKQLAEDSKNAGSGTDSGHIDWDWVCNTWGSGRTRHQILIKATNLGLKESSTRGVKRRRETDQGTDDGTLSVNGSVTTQAILNAVGAAADASASASPERPASTSISPAAVHQQVPAPPAPPGGGNLLHWGTGMSSPVMSGGSRSVYYNKSATKA